MGEAWRVLSGPFHNYAGIRPPMHPAPRRCSLVKYSRYSPSSRLAGRAPRRPRCLTVIMKRTTKWEADLTRLVAGLTLEGLFAVLTLERRRQGNASNGRDGKREGR